MKNRCAWVTKDVHYEKYHDTEWGVPVFDDHILFEFLILETFQAGLSWLTVLRKRENFKQAFADFDFEKVANFDETKIQELLQNQGIIRNQLKIRAAVSNAVCFIKVRREYGSFANYIWQFIEGKPIINHWNSIKEVPASTPLSDTISKNLKKRGFKFVGTTVVYAHMQATGMVQDHTTDCFRHSELS